MVGSIGERMLGITLPHVDAWNMWWSSYGNTVEGFIAEKNRVDGFMEAAGRAPGDVAATAAVLVQLEGGTGRQMGDHEADSRPEPLMGTPSELADQLREFEAAGASHIQLCVDPIDHASIEWLGEVLREF
jgi:alkanesulfonate monooxygenase SsuD/methylene tetrahydromethanopterin reductase-like flavin-dependent oxidoreductase (luciferase family)